MKILVTGGAGYIGSICVEELIRQNHEVVVLDNLQEGHRKAVVPEAHFIKGDVGNRKTLDEIFDRQEIAAVMHFAALATIELSMRDPFPCFENNVMRGLTLLEAMRRVRCTKMIFSSSASVFGNPESLPIDEKHPINPINAYGESKAIFERILDWYSASYGFKINSFRYFNAAGASELLGEDHRNESHLIPLLIRTALGKRDKIGIFGSDYETKDGTCVRDYIHVRDIALAHIQALDNLDRKPNEKYNLANGNGFTNLEVLRMVEKISGKSIPFELTDRRPGDPGRLVASAQKARQDLGWSPSYATLEDIVSSAWKWHLAYPDGYES
jgi:UDP-glucose 4-epimerase